MYEFCTNLKGFNEKIIGCDTISSVIGMDFNLCFWHGGNFMSIPKEIGQNIVYLRKIGNITQEWLALEVNMSVAYLRAIEHGRANPTVEMLSKIGLAYNVNLNWLINEIGNMFIETHQRRLIKTGSDGFVTEEITEPQSVSVMEKPTTLMMVTPSVC